MTNKNISALTAATVPLAGTELIPVWDGATKKVSVNSLYSAIPYTWGSGWVGIEVNNLTYAGSAFAGGSGSTDMVANAYNDGTNWKFKVTAYGLPALRYSQDFGTGTAEHSWYRSSAVGTNPTTVTFTKQWSIDGSDNLVPRVAGKGINFTANTPAAGMTSQLLNWYEEGTWTPAYRAGAATFTYPSYRYGKYTRVGNMVTVFARIATSSISGGSPGDTIYIGGLPFASSSTAQIGVSLTFATAFNSNTPITAFLNQSTTEFNLHYRATTVSGVSQNTYADLLNGADKNDISFSFSYTV